MLRIRKKKEEEPEPPVGGEALLEIAPEADGITIDESVGNITDETGESEIDVSPEGVKEDTQGEAVDMVAPVSGVTSEFESEAEAFAKGREISGERLEEGVSCLDKIGKAWREGALTVEMLEVVIRGLDYERAVAQARSEGELEGRNAQIEEKYMRPADSDGLPHFSGKGNVGRSSRRTSSIFDLARDAG